MTTQEDDGEDQGGSRFPFITLSSAIDRARQLYKQAGDHAVPIAEAIKIWGYSEKASGWKQTAAALKYYGLIQSIGVKEGRKLKLTDDGRRYFLDERPEEHAKAHLKFALMPQALSTLWNLWRDKPPSDPIARSTLKLDFHYAENAANQLLSIYKANIVFAGLASPGADSGLGDVAPPSTGPLSADLAPRLSGAQSVPAASTENVDPPPVPMAHPVRHKAGVHLMDGERELTTGLLSKGGANFRLIVSGHIGEKEIDRLIRKLTIDKEILADADNDSDRDEELTAQPSERQH